MQPYTRLYLLQLVEGDFNPATYYKGNREAQVAMNPNSSPQELLRLVREYPQLVWDNPVVVLLALEDPAWFHKLRAAYQSAPTAKAREIGASSRRLNLDTWFAEETNKFVAEWLRAFYDGLKEHEKYNGESLDVDSYRDYGADAIEDLSGDSNLFVEAYRKAFGSYPSDKVENKWFEQAIVKYHGLVSHIQSMSETGYPATPAPIRQLLMRYPHL